MRSSFCVPGTLLLSPPLSEEGTAVLVPMRTSRVHQEGPLAKVTQLRSKAGI